MDLERDAGMKITANKTKVLRLTGHRTLCINGQNFKGVDQFIYLGCIVSTDGNIELDIVLRINCA